MPHIIPTILATKALYDKNPGIWYPARIAFTSEKPPPSASLDMYSLAYLFKAFGHLPAAGSQVREEECKGDPYGVPQVPV